MLSLSVLIHGALGVFGTLVFWRAVRLPTAPQGKQGEKLSVIIPARNEENNIGHLLSSLREGSVLPEQVLVADDGSSDGTADVARRQGAHVVTCREAPTGWQGKNWACAEGARVAQGDFFLFLDADTVLEKDGLAKLLFHAQRFEGAFSLAPYHEVIRPHEFLSAFFNVVQMMASGAFAPFASRRTKRLFGPCLFIRRTDYLRVGGHAAVKDKILENFFLSQLLFQAGIPIGSASGEGVLRYRMYPTGLGDLIRGWSKALARGATGASLGVLIAIVFWFIGALGTARHFFGTLPAGLSGTLFLPALFYGFYTLQIYGMVRRAGRFGMGTALFYPVGMVFFVGVFFYSVFRRFFGRTTLWKGRPVSS